MIIALGLVNWFGTYLLVESEFFRPLRDWVDDRHLNAQRRFPVWLWWKLQYFVKCPTCTGTWVGLALVPFAPAVWPGVLGFIVMGLLIKAIGHLVLVVHKYLEALTDYKQRRKLQ